MRWQVEPEDFVVAEIPLYPASGRGLHAYLEIEKRLCTTEEVARALARAAGVRPGEVGYAGRKDRRAVARQWFSVPGLDPEQAIRLRLPGARVLSAVRHDHKLRTGHLRGNRFRLRLRDLDAAESARLALALQHLQRDGMPNRFGEQRFGRDGRNPERGLALLRGRDRVRDRRQARFLLSAFQAAVFNRVLERRPRPLGRLEAGDLAMVHASGGVFRVDDPRREQTRADVFEISPTGPIVGTRTPEPAGRVARVEREVLAGFGVDLAQLAHPGPGLRLRGGRRALRVQAKALKLEPVGRDQVVLHCELPPGSYATVLLEELARRLCTDVPEAAALATPSSAS